MSSSSGARAAAAVGAGGVYDRFRERVIFPIRDANGSPVGLGGLLWARGPYLNSPATPLFDKSRTLYLVDKAKGPIRKAGRRSSSRATPMR
jgi:DNA primase